MLVGSDGGFYATYDRVAHWDHLNHAGHRPVLPRRRGQPAPYRVYGGLQDNGSWGGPVAVSPRRPGPSTTTG